MFEVSVHYTDRVTLIDESRKFYCEDMNTAQAVKDSLMQKFSEAMDGKCNTSVSKLCESLIVSECGNISLHVNIVLALHKVTTMDDIKSIPLVVNNDYKKGMEDCKIGVYDKWFRYHRTDDGTAYDNGWQKQNETTQNESVQFIMS